MTKCEIPKKELKEHLKICLNNLLSSDTPEELNYFHHSLEVLEFLQYKQDLEK